MCDASAGCAGPVRSVFHQRRQLGRGDHAIRLHHQRVQLGVVDGVDDDADPTIHPAVGRHVELLRLRPHQQLLHAQRRIAPERDATSRAVMPGARVHREDLLLYPKGRLAPGDLFECLGHAQAAATDALQWVAHAAQLSRGTSPTTERKTLSCPSRKVNCCASRCSYGAPVARQRPRSRAISMTVSPCAVIASTSGIWSATLAKFSSMAAVTAL